MRISASPRGFMPSTNPMAFRASRIGPGGASTCTTECGGSVPGQAGLTQAATSVATSGGAETQGAAVAESAFLFRLAGNHNETVLVLA